jgi:hypothetical protein
MTELDFDILVMREIDYLYNTDPRCSDNTISKISTKLNLDRKLVRETFVRFRNLHYMDALCLSTPGLERWGHSEPYRRNPSK